MHTKGQFYVIFEYYSRFFPLLDKSVILEAGKTVAEACALVGFLKIWFAGAKEPVKNVLSPFVKTI